MRRSDGKILVAGFRCVRKGVVVLSQPLENLSTQVSPFVVKIADSPYEISQALRLRYKVFALEKENPNLYNESSLEEDEYDKYCKHMIVPINTNDDFWMELAKYWEEQRVQVT
jgi:putative hemolysin